MDLQRAKLKGMWIQLQKRDSLTLNLNMEDRDKWDSRAIEAVGSLSSVVRTYVSMDMVTYV